MTGALLGRPLLPLNGAAQHRCCPNTKDVSSRHVALRNRLSITDLQPPPPPPGRRRLRSAMLINPSASSPPPLLPFISAKLSSHAFSCQPAILPIAHRRFRPAPLSPRRHFSGTLPPARTPSFRTHTFLIRDERHCGIPRPHKASMHASANGRSKYALTSHIYSNGWKNLEVWEPVPGKPSQDPGSPQ